MTTQFNSGAPVAGQLSAEERAQAAGETEARKASATALDRVGVSSYDAAAERGYTTYVSARTHANSRFLVTPGKLVTGPLHPGVPLGMTPASHREGDVWAQFSNGVLVTDDPTVISWCEAHPKVCRDARNPLTQAWAAIKEMQARVNNRDAVLDGSLDADAMFFPDNPEVQAAILAAGAVKSDRGAALVKSALVAEDKQRVADQERAADSSRLDP